jgi:hypothetical protein
VKDEIWKHNGRSWVSIQQLANFIMFIEEERKKEFKYYCEECDFGNFSKGLFKLHMESKHKTK